MGSHPPRKVETVCVIGAGPSGISAAKYLQAEDAFSQITVFEQRSSVGGIWTYVPIPEDPSAIDLAVPQTSPHVGHDEPIWHKTAANKVLSGDSKDAVTFMTPLYDRLETNIPRGLMGFSDLKWPEDCQLFPPHREVLKYIERYAENVLHFIRFGTQVLRVQLTEDSRWLVRVQDVTKRGRGATSDHIFDAVVVASGHFDVPYIPRVKGIEQWHKAYPGSISHSKFYRQPGPYKGQKVIVIGNSASGIDIGAQIKSVCKWPLLVSQKSESYLQVEKDPAIVEKHPIAEYIVESRSVRFEDGSIESDVDGIIYCTGYFYSFPFLDGLDPPVVTTGERVENLYQHIFYRPHPTLTFAVLNQKVIPFPTAEVQSAVIARMYSGRLELPTHDEMKRWEDDAVRQQGNGRFFHVLKFPKDANYINLLHDWAVSADTQGRCGKSPPSWGELEFWTRERFPKIKKVFQSLGEQRHQVRKLEEIGFDFEQWKTSQAGEEDRN